MRAPCDDSMVLSFVRWLLTCQALPSTSTDRPLKDAVPQGAQQAAEKPNPDGGGGFNPRIKPKESMRALPRRNAFRRWNAKAGLFPQHVMSVPVSEGAFRIFQAAMMILVSARHDDFGNAVFGQELAVSRPT